MNEIHADRFEDQSSEYAYIKWFEELLEEGFTPEQAQDILDEEM